MPEDWMLGHLRAPSVQARLGSLLSVVPRTLPVCPSRYDCPVADSWNTLVALRPARSNLPPGWGRRARIFFAPYREEHPRHRPIANATRLLGACTCSLPGHGRVGLRRMPSTSYFSCGSAYRSSRRRR